MGKYLNHLASGEPLPQKGKVQALLTALGDSASKIGPEELPETVAELPEGYVLVVVVENTHFDAALVVETEYDLSAVKAEKKRTATYILIDNRAVPNPTEYKQEA